MKIIITAKCEVSVHGFVISVISKKGDNITMNLEGSKLTIGPGSGTNTNNTGNISINDIDPDLTEMILRVGDGVITALKSLEIDHGAKVIIYADVSDCFHVIADKGSEVKMIQRFGNTKIKYASVTLNNGSKLDINNVFWIKELDAKLTNHSKLIGVIVTKRLQVGLETSSRFKSEGSCSINLGGTARITWKREPES